MGINRHALGAAPLETELDVGPLAVPNADSSNGVAGGNKELGGRCAHVASVVADCREATASSPLYEGTEAPFGASTRSINTCTTLRRCIA